MDFLRILRSLEEFVYEVMTWLLFYPRTILRTIHSPLTMLRYSDREQSDAPDERYTETMSPPLFLMVTIVISHLIETAAHQNLPEATTAFGREILASETNSLILRSILFAVYPLFFAVERLRREQQPITRDSLRGPFFAQCFVAAPAAFGISMGAILGRASAIPVAVAGAVLTLVCIIWYLCVEAAWLCSHAKMKLAPAASAAFGTWLKASIFSGLISVAVLGVAAAE
jgi:hypothetical protein